METSLWTVCSQIWSFFLSILSLMFSSRTPLHIREKQACFTYDLSNWVLQPEIVVNRNAKQAIIPNRYSTSSFTWLLAEFSGRVSALFLVQACGRITVSSVEVSELRLVAMFVLQPLHCFPARYSSQWGEWVHPSANSWAMFFFCGASYWNVRPLLCDSLGHCPTPSGNITFNILQNEMNESWCASLILQ